MREVFVFGFQAEPEGKYNIKWSITKKKAFNTFYKNKAKYFRCGVFLCKTIKDYQIVKYAECGEECPVEMANKPTIAALI